MKQLYEKSQLGFALLWIGIYVVAFGAADGISTTIGVEKLVTAVLALALSVGLLAWLKGQKLLAQFGLVKSKASAKQFLYYLPLAVMASVNLWGGVTLRFGVPETVLYVLSMIGVGFLEELIFRGFLFKALCRENVKQAVLISGITFGIGHVINLLNGADVVPTLLQICYAAAAGILFALIFHRSGSLLPCILAHSAINALDAFRVEWGMVPDMITAVFLTAVSLGYALWIVKKTPTQ